MVIKKMLGMESYFEKKQKVVCLEGDVKSKNYRQEVREKYNV